MRPHRLSALPMPVKSDILDLPPIDTWVNIRSFGADGGRNDRRYRRVPESDRSAPHDLLALGSVSRDRHDHAEAGYSSHRPASECHTNTCLPIQPQLFKALAVLSRCLKLQKAGRIS